jgi:two-component system, sensor histidine kinase and response regulator
MRTTVVDSGRAALQALKQATTSGEPFRLVLLDAHMPEMDGFAVAQEIQHGRQRTGAAIVMLTSASHPSDAAHCRQLGIDACLMKPLKQSELYNVILTVLRKGHGLKSEVESGPVNTEKKSNAWPSSLANYLPTSDLGPRTSFRILLVEDNVVNQKLALRLLEKRGYFLRVAGNGKEALKSLEKESFDLILMDVQMPEMDGLEATVHIRRTEQGSGRHVPILAMTAHAMTGDQERCLQAGMDGYISKPIQSQELFEAIDRLLSSGAAGVAGDGSASSLQASDQQDFDKREAMTRVGGDEKLLRELAKLFLDTVPEQMSVLRSALEREDGPASHCAAHGLKGAAGTMGARAVFAAAARVEMLARAGDLTHAAQACAALEDAFVRLQPVLAELVIRNP